MKSIRSTNENVSDDNLDLEVEVEHIEDEVEFSDKSIECTDCASAFIWSVGEQEFFRDKGLKNPPKRCKPCKKAKNERIRSLNSPNSRQKIEVQVNCAECDTETTVPFYPSQGRPVFCRSCFIKQNPNMLGSSER